MRRSFRAKAVCNALILSAVVACGGCGGIPEGVDAVADFDVQRYLGTWYEIARLDHRFERGLSNVSATYSLRNDGGIKVVNRGYHTGSEEWRQAEGKAYFVAGPSVGRLKVSFFGPFYGGYNIIELDGSEYRYSMVTGNDRTYLWILSRTPELEPAILRRLLSKADALGFATDELIFVEHGGVTAD